ncbi:hypothetical protein GCM10010341_86370 [Streptomyces noursei]|nr:hypothetical protein GCM10010341_86370 [Streptomyces noursei]
MRRVLCRLPARARRLTTAPPEALDERVDKAWRAATALWWPHSRPADAEEVEFAPDGERLLMDGFSLTRADDALYVQSNAGGMGGPAPARYPLTAERTEMFETLWNTADHTNLRHTRVR